MAMPSLGRRMNYQAAEADRESVQVLDSEGKDLSIEQKCGATPFV